MKWKILILIVGLIVVGIGALRYFGGLQRAYRRQVRSSLAAVPENPSLITEEDLTKLPEALRRFLEYAGVVGTERVTHFKVVFDGSMRMDRDSDWAPVDGEQYTFLGEGRRLFSMKMNYRGLPLNGLHHYSEGEAYMTIKIFDLVRIIHNQDEIMRKGETVTWFNDLCLMAPGALLDADVRWEEIDANHVLGRLTNDGITVEAVLTIDEEGRLVNFESDDRYAAHSDGTYDRIPWSTPMDTFAVRGGLNLPVEGEAVWHYPEGNFSYIRLKIQEVVINP